MRKALENYITENYGATPEYLWIKYPSYAVFRHSDNRKWFAVTMTIPKRVLGISGADSVEVVNLKAPTELVPLLVTEEGIYPAYHMSKEHWITVNLDEYPRFDKLISLLSLSHSLTQRKIPKNKTKSD